MKVILADDDISFRTILSRFTQLLPDFEVIGEATNGEELVQMVISKKPDIVLVDVNMAVVFLCTPNPLKHRRNAWD